MRLITDRRWAFGLLCVALAAVYLTWWIAYAASSQSDQYRVLDRGAALMTSSGTARVISLAASDEMSDVKGGEPEAPDANAMWVVATIEVQVRRATTRTWCDTQLVSTTRRVWPEGGPSVERTLPDCDDRDIVIGQPYRYEAVFQVPVSDIDAIAGIALRDTSTHQRTPILTPAG